MSRPFTIASSLALGLLLWLAGAGPAVAQHTVKQGDTLNALSRKYGVSAAEIRAANGLDGDNIVLGKALKIPKSVGNAPAAGGEKVPVQVRRAQPVNPKQKVIKEAPAPTKAPTAKAPARGGEYVVQPGDSLTRLANRYGTTVAALRSANGLEGDSIVSGQPLVIPSKGAKTAAVEKPADKKKPDLAKEKEKEKPKAKEKEKPTPIAQEAPKPKPGQAAASSQETVHYVLEGDRISLLAKRYGVSSDSIRQANKLEADLIRVGQMLVVPAASGGTPTPVDSADPDAAREALAKAAPTAAATKPTGPVWERPEHYLDLVDLSASSLPAPPKVDSAPAPLPEKPKAPEAAPKASHVVGDGDSLWKISRKHKVSVEKIREANGLKDDSIQSGQKLVIP